MGFFAKRRMDKILEGRDEATREKISQISRLFADYVPKHGMRFSYDRYDGQFKPSKDPSNYDAIYITPFDADELSRLIMSYKGIKEPDPNADESVKVGYRVGTDLAISRAATGDVNSQIVSAVKNALGYPQNKPLDLIFSMRAYDLKSAKVCDSLYVFFDRKENYIGRQYNPYFLGVRKQNGEIKKLAEDRDGNKSIEVTKARLNLPNMDKRIDKYYPSPTGNAAMKRMYNLITSDLPWYKLGLATEEFLDKKIDENSPIDSNTRSEFVRYLYDRLQ